MEKYKKIIEKQKELIEQYQLFANWINKYTKDIIESQRGRDYIFSFIKLESEISSLKAEMEKEEKPKEVVKCDHPLSWQKHYHDASVVCTKCNCIIEQFGKKIDPPSRLSMMPKY